MKMLVAAIVIATAVAGCVSGDGRAPDGAAFPVIERWWK